MDVNLVIYGVFVCFAGLFLSAILSLSKRYLKFAANIFIFANAIGFLAGLAYFINFSGKEIILANFNWFFHLSPTFNFLSAIFFTLISGIAAIVGIYSKKYLALYEKTYNRGVTQFLTAFFVLGMLGVLLANNPFGFLFFWEIMSITSFFLVMADGAEESVRAAFLYFVMTHLGASAILGGFLILGNGNLYFNFSDIYNLASNLSPMLFSLALVLFIFGFGSKAGLVPFHTWLPEAHPQAPSNVSAMMSGLMLKVAVYGFVAIVFSFPRPLGWVSALVLILGIISGISGALHAAAERDIKRAFAYSSIENMGIIFMMLGLAMSFYSKQTAILSFAIFHAVNHAFFKTALFLSSGVIISRVHSRRLGLMGGLAKMMPVFSFAFLLAIFASLPLVPFGTFYGEWGFVQNIISLFHETYLSPTGFIALTVILSAVGLVGGLAIFAMVKIFGISMLGLCRTKHIEERDEKNDYALIIPVLILSLAVLVLGILAKPLIAWLTSNLANFQGVSSGSQSAIIPVHLSSVAIFFVVAFVLGFIYFAYSIFVKNKKERIYHTWDCGQPIDSSMEYTSSAFSGPIRFFFLNLLKREKKITSTPIVATNPWIRKYEFSLVIKSVWEENFYTPIAKKITSLAEKIKVIQSGRIHYYLLFLLGTLILTLIFAL